MERIPILRMGKCLLVTIQVDMEDRTALGLQDDLSSKIADILQCTPDSKGDHILAARFLKHFVPDSIPWIHLDLSASNRSGGLAHIPSDFTGFGLRFTYQLLQQPNVFPLTTTNHPAAKRPRASLRS